MALYKKARSEHSLQPKARLEIVHILQAQPAPSEEHKNDLMFAEAILDDTSELVKGKYLLGSPDLPKRIEA